MFSSANKTTKIAPAAQAKAPGTSFFRKAGEESFFGTREGPSFFGKPVQAKLTVSTPDDPHEKEADAVAEKVMRMEDPVIASKEAKEKEKIQTKEEVKTHQPATFAGAIQCKEKNKLQAKAERISRKDEGRIGRDLVNTSLNGLTIYRKNISLYKSDIMRQSGRGPPATSMQFEQTLSSSKGGGSALPRSTQNFMESRFNADFSGVRIHTNPTAISLATSLNAQAFAHGSDIYFNSGKYSPDTTDGKTLLAHELTHTIQQGASKSNPSPKPNAHRLSDNKTSSPVNLTPDQKINEHKDDGVLHKKEETKHVDQKPQRPPPVQLKGELTRLSINNKGALNSNHSPVSPVRETKVQTKEEEKQEQPEKNSTNQLEIQKKHEQPLLSHCQCCDSAVPAVQSRCNMKLQPKHFDSSIARKYNIENAELISKQDRGPPSVSVIDTNVIQRSVVDDALSYAGSVTDCASLSLDTAIACAKGKAQQVAMHIPGYKALRVVLGKDPITGEGVAFSGRNFIEAAFDIMPGGNLLYQKLDELHKLDAAAQWIDEKIGAVKDYVSGLLSQISNFWHSLGITDLASPLEVLKRGANIVFGFIGRVVDFAVATAKDLLKIVKDFLLDKIVDFIKSQTPAYPLLIVILGKDPITDQKVERNGTNILNALLELGGEEGREQRKQMQDTGTFKKVADYIDKGIAIFSGAYEQIKKAFQNIWQVVSINSLMNPVETFRQIYNQFAGPVKKVWDFVKETAAIILKFIKEVLFKRISAEAKKVRGYTLVTVIIGEDPFTKEVVPPTVENLIHGFMSLMDGGEEQFQQMKESGAVAKAEQKIKAAVKKLNMTPQSIIQLFIDLWNSLTLNDLAHPIDAFNRIIAKFGEPIGRLIAFVVEIVKIVVEVILIIMQFPFDLINNIIAKAMQAIDKIKADPIGFLKNLLRAIKEGFVQFFGNILKHLLAGLTGWLMSELKDANVKAPKDFSLGTIIGWVLDLLGISMEKIWEKLAKHPKIGPQRVAKIRGVINKLEGIWTFIKDVQERGIAAIWDKIVEKLSNLWDTVLNAIKDWIIQQIIEKIVTKLLSMLDPTGIMAVINSAIALYKAIQSFKKYVMQILQIVNSFVEGLVEIASGNTKKAADFLESTLARGVPVVIGFLANQVGLSGVGKKVGEMIEKVRDMVDKALTWLVNKAVDTGFALFDKLMGGGGDKADGPSLDEKYGPEKAAKINAGLQAIEAAEQPLLNNGKITKEEAEKVAQAVKTQHTVFKTLEVVDGGDKWDFEYSASEKTKVKGKIKDVVPDGTQKNPYPLYWPSLLSHAPVASPASLKKVKNSERDSDVAYQIRQREILFQFSAMEDKSSDPLIIKQFRKALKAKFGIKASLKEYNLDGHLHHVHPLFLNGQDNEENIIMLDAQEHLQGHVVLRTQAGAPGPPDGMPLDKRDLYNDTMHPNNTYYFLKGEI
jgi:hypothetical protein